jgi:hypothetical protein
MINVRRIAIVVAVLALGCLAGAAGGVLAKADIIARLDAPLPTSAPAGEPLTVGWTLVLPGGGGLTGTAVVLRLYPAHGGASVDVTAREDQPGHWVASVIVPVGGLATIGIGIPGESCVGSVCRPALDLFTVTEPSGSLVPSPATLNVPATNTSLRPSSGGLDKSTVLLMATFIIGSVLVACALAMRRRT